jgi:hypothetical protein
MSTAQSFFAATRLFLVELPTSIQVIKVHDRIEHEKVTALCLTPPKWIRGEEQHVTISARDVYNSRSLSNFVAAI